MFRSLCTFALAALAMSGPAVAQTKTATPPVMPEKSTKVGAVEILQVRPNVFMLTAGGTNAAVLVGDEGVLVVDTLTAQAAPDLVKAIQSLSSKPILQIISTHSDPEHVGGNEIVRQAGTYTNTGNTRDGGGASILGFENTLNRMSADGSPYPKAAWPTDSFFVKQKDLFMNGDAVNVMHQPAADTDGDAMVLFRRNDVLVTGDVFTPERYPMIDVQAGGTINGLLDGLNHILEITVPEFNEEGGTIVIPGHGRLCDEADVGDYRDMATIVRDRVWDMVKKNATLEQVKAAKLTLDYDGIYASPSYTGDMFVEAIYKTLPKPPAPAPAAAPARGRR